MVTQFVKFNALNIAKASAAGVLNRAVSQGAENIKRSLGRNPTPTPFAAARGRKNGLILAYPFNVDEDERQGHFIKFKIKEQVSQGKLKSPKSPSQVRFEEFGESELDAAGFDDITFAIPPGAQQSFAQDGFLANLNSSNLSSARGRTNRSLVLEKLENRQTVKQIALYMPATIDVNYTVTYGDNEIGALAMVGQNILEGLMSPGSTLEKLRGAVAGLDTMAGEGVDRFVQNFADTVASGAKTLFELNRGTVITPRMELMFEGVGRRNFSFTFDFIPKSKEEAKTVNDIVYNFKKYMMPEFSNPETRREMNIPATFDISYHYLSGENPFLNKISTCFLKQMDVKYGGDRFTAYEETLVGQDAPGGSGFPPQKTQITLNFTELDTMSRKHIEEGH